jgi:hypothetical protein
MSWLHLTATLRPHGFTAPDDTDQSPQGGFEANTILYIYTVFHRRGARGRMARRKRRASLSNQGWTARQPGESVEACEGLDCASKSKTRNADGGNP